MNGKRSGCNPVAPFEVGGSNPSLPTIILIRIIMNILIQRLIDTIVLSLLIIGNVYSITWMLNISLFLYWIIAVCLIIVLFMDDNDVFKYNTRFTWFPVFMWLISTFVMVGFGYFVLGSIYFVCGSIQFTRHYKYFFS